MTANEYLDLVASQGCVMASLGHGPECNGRVCIHHVREGQGMGQRAPAWLGVALCETHHVGSLGIHDRKSFYRRTRLDEMDLLAETIRLTCACMAPAKR